MRCHRMPMKYQKRQKSSSELGNAFLRITNIRFTLVNEHSSTKCTLYINKCGCGPKSKEVVNIFLSFLCNIHFGMD